MFAIGMIIGVIIGIISASVAYAFAFRPIGTLKRHVDPDDGIPYLFLELFEDDMYKINKQSLVAFKVDLKDYNTRK